VPPVPATNRLLRQSKGTQPAAFSVPRCDPQGISEARSKHFGWFGESKSKKTDGLV